jgi:hypothetical protein
MGYVVAASLPVSPGAEPLRGSKFARVSSAYH